MGRAAESIGVNHFDAGSEYLDNNLTCYGAVGHEAKYTVHAHCSKKHIVGSLQV